MSTGIRGGTRFEGYGNVILEAGRNYRGWQLTCSRCQAKSDVLHRKGTTLPPRMLFSLFHKMGWKVGHRSAHKDLCPKCMEAQREANKAERQSYINGNVDRLLDLIRQIDLMLASNVAVEYGPYKDQITAQLKSLFETAFLCDLLPRNLWNEVNGGRTGEATPVELEGGLTASPPVPKEEPNPWDEVLLPIPVPQPEEKPHVEFQHGPHIDSLPTQRPSDPPPQDTPQVIADKVNVIDMPRRMNPRTAAMLAEVRAKLREGKHH